MPLYNRQQRKQLDQLVEDFAQHKVGRREFMQRSVAVGLSASAAVSLLAACGGASPASSNTNNANTPTPSNKVDLLNVWSGEELDSWKAVVAPYETQNKVTVTAESTRDLSSTLTTRIRGNNAPDMAILPNPGFMQQLAAQGKLVPLDSFLDMDQIKKDYSQGWIDLGTYNGHLYALFYKAANKATIWYNPKSFQAGGYTPPTTWTDLIALSDKIAQSGKYPWSIGAQSSGGSSGWPTADWIDQIYLSQNGGDMYDKWVKHQIPWTDPSVKTAFQTFGQIAGGKHYIAGAPQSIVATDYESASYLPFKNPPAAYMYCLGDFTEGFITGHFKSAVAGTDFNFFPFPTINSQYANAITGGADVVVALKNTTAVQSLVKYMATAAAQEIWVKRGGFTSPNKSVDLSAYPDAVSKASAQQLTNAAIFRFGADDLMPQAVENAYWQATLQYVQTPDKLDSILSSVEAKAASSYSS